VLSHSHFQIHHTVRSVAKGFPAIVELAKSSAGFVEVCWRCSTEIVFHNLLEHRVRRRLSHFLDFLELNVFLTALLEIKLAAIHNRESDTEFEGQKKRKGKLEARRARLEYCHAFSDVVAFTIAVFRTYRETATQASQKLPGFIAILEMWISMADQIKAGTADTSCVDQTLSRTWNKTAAKLTLHAKSNSKFPKLPILT
jgi:hypothetical protein